jgi:acyl-CoA synthetase (AMP-forming)/AMP-acid ligase II
MHKWNAAVAADLIEEHGVTQTAGVPMQVQQLLDIVDEGRDLPSLTSIGIGATAVPPHLPTRIWQTFGGRVAPLTGYGMTETTSSVTSLSGEEFVERPSSVGRPHPFNEVRVLAENQEVPVGGIGEIWVRGPNVTTLEWTRTGTAAVRHSADFLPTGDLGSLDEEGYLYIVGRSKDMIIRSGENVYSAEVEAALLALPGITGAAVIGLPHPRWGEEVTAILRKRPRAEVDLAAVRARLADELAYFKVPTRYHLTDTDFPSTATGKTLKRELREIYADVVPDLHEGADNG